jgi:putative ABC transport system substrate-binding protein
MTRQAVQAGDHAHGRTYTRREVLCSAIRSGIGIAVASVVGVWTHVPSVAGAASSVTFDGGDMRALRCVLGVALMLGLFAAPCAVGGQTPGNVRRIGVIHRGGPYEVVVDGLRQGLRDLGLEDGKHIVLDIRASSDLQAVEEAAKDLERGKVDLIYTVATSVTIAAKRATVHTPIVFFAGSDPVAAGLVESFAHPGGRLTGVHSLSTDLTAKRLEILKEMMPTLGRVVTFYDPGNALSREGARLGREAAGQLGVQLVERHVSSVEELRQGLQELRPREVDAYFYTTDLIAVSQADLIIDAARIKRLPTMFEEVSIVAKGALAGYGHSFHANGRTSAKHVQRILAGTNPKDLPVENVYKIAFVLNLRTAREIGLTIPPMLLFQADEVIQ